MERALRRKVIRQFLLLLLTCAFLVSTLPEAVFAAGEKPEIKVVNYPPAVEEGEPLNYEVTCANAKEGDEVRYTWRYLIRNGYENFGKREEGCNGSGTLSYNWKDCDGVSWMTVEGGKLTVDGSKTVDFNHGDYDTHMVFSCRVSLNGVEEDSIVFDSVGVQHNYVETVHISGTPEPNQGDELRFDFMSYTEHVAVSRVKWDFLQDGQWISLVKGSKAEQAGDYRLSVILKIDDGWFVRGNAAGITTGIIGKRESTLYNYSGSDGQVVLYQIFTVGGSEAATLQDTGAFEQWAVGNLFRLKEQSALYGTPPEEGKTTIGQRPLPKGSVVQIVSLSGAYCLVDYQGEQGYIERSRLKFYGYSDPDRTNLKDYNYQAICDVKVAKDYPLGPVAGVLPKGTIVTFIEANGTVAKIRYGYHYGYVPMSCFVTSIKPATDIEYLTKYLGLYRVTANTVNVRADASTESDRLGGLKKGDIVCAMDIVKDGSGQSFLAFYYQRRMAFILMDALEKVPPEEEEEAMKPYITIQPEDVTVKEGEDAVFSFSGKNPVLYDTAYLDDDGNPQSAQTLYYFFPDIPVEEIEQKGWGHVYQHVSTPTLKIEKVTKELDGLKIVGVMSGLDSVMTEEAYLHVISDDAHTDRPKEEVRDVSIEGTNPVVRLIRSARDVTTGSQDVELADESMDDTGLTCLRIFPKNGKYLSEETRKNLAVRIPGYRLKDSKLLEDGSLEIRLEPLTGSESVSSNPSLLAVSPASLVFDVGDTADQSLAIQNATGGEAVLSVEGGALPDGLSIKGGKLTGIPQAGSEGFYTLKLKANTPEVSRTETKTVQREETYQKRLRDTIETQTVEETIPASYYRNAPDDNGWRVFHYQSGLYDLEVFTAPSMSEPNRINVSIIATKQDTGEDMTEPFETRFNADGSIWFSMEMDVVVPHYEQATRTVTKQVTEQVKVCDAQEAAADLTVLVLPSHRHNYIATETTATDCSKPQVRRFRCACGDTYEIEETAPGHEWGEWVPVAGDCLDGTDYERICGRCGLTEHKREEQGGHSDFDLDGVCDHCGEDLSMTFISYLTDIPVDQLKAGSPLPAHLLFNGRELSAEEQQEHDAIVKGTDTDGTDTGEDDPDVPETEETDPEKGQGTKKIIIMILLLFLLVLIILAVVYFVSRKLKKEKKKEESGEE